MTRKTQRIAGAWIGIMALILMSSSPVEAGTCSPVKTKGHASDAATATTRAHIKLTQQAARIGGKARQVSTNCTPDRKGFLCTIKAVVCP